MGRPYINLIGQRFGKLTVVELYERQGAHKAVKWKCVCDCGGEKIADSQMLRRGYITDCGCKIRNRLVGQRFGKLTVLDPTDMKNPGKCGNIIWKCQCDCGNITYVQTCNLIAKKNKTVSCGCHRIEKATKHGKAGEKIYKTWTAMKQRCVNENNKHYKDYGGRGITVCEEWAGENGFENFYNWSINNGYDEKLTIDRIDNNSGYRPDNCRWTTKRVQANNTRQNHYVTINGETHTLTEWAEIYKMNLETVRNRIKAGWSDVEAITTPVIKHGYTRKNFVPCTRAEND